MDKSTIRIRRIRENTVFEIEDEVAVEYHRNILLQNGNIIPVACTPSFADELILGRRFLMRDLTLEELEQLGYSQGYQDMGTEQRLKEVQLEEIFRIAREAFEQPGSLFADTGCAHSCALVYKGNVVCHIEDIGRHNALDKVIGYALKHRIPVSDSYVFCSGRISEDYLQKVIGAGFPMVVSRAAVTKSAVMLAREKQITMLGFIRKNSGNIYQEGMVSLRP